MATNISRFANKTREFARAPECRLLFRWNIRYLIYIYILILCTRVQCVCVTDARVVYNNTAVTIELIIINNGMTC